MLRGMTNEQLIARSNKLRKMMGAEPLPYAVAQKVIKQTKVAKKRVNKPKEVVPSEHEEQVKVIEWCDAHPVAKHIYAIPNGSHKSPAMANKFKREGLRSGVPDLFLPVARGAFHGMFIEMKRVKGSVVSDEQRKRMEDLDGLGYFVYMAKGAEKAIGMIEWYLAQ